MAALLPRCNCEKKLLRRDHIGTLQSVFDRLIGVFLDSGAQLIEFGQRNIFYVRRPIEVIHVLSCHLRAIGADSGDRLGLKNGNQDLGVRMCPVSSEADGTE